MGLRPARTIRGVLFDKDGTLLDFEATWRAVYVDAAGSLARHWSDPSLAPAMLAAAGFDADTGCCLADSVLASGANAEIAAVWARAAGQVCDDWLTREVDRLFVTGGTAAMVPTVADLPAVLGTLRAQGLRLGLATMDSAAGAQACLAALEIGSFFDFVCGYDSGFGTKPGAGMVQAFCQRTGLDAGEIMMVGDTLHDMNMGRSACVGLTVAVRNGAGAPASLAALADRMIDDVSQLDGLLATFG